MRAPPPVPPVVDDRPQALAQERPHHRGQLDVAGDLPASLHTTPLPGRSMRCTRRGFHSTPPLATALMKRATCIGVTSTRALADRHVHGLAGVPAAAPSARRGLGCGNEPELLAAEDRSRSAAPSPKACAYLAIAGAADLEPGLVEVDVAGLRDGPEQVDGAVPSFFQSLNVHVPRWNSPVHSRGRSGVSVPSCRPAAATMILNTEPGAYWRLDRAVQQRMVGILDRPAATRRGRWCP